MSCYSTVLQVLGFRNIVEESIFKNENRSRIKAIVKTGNALKIFRPFKVYIHNRVLFPPENVTTKTKGEHILQQQLLGITKLHKINGMWFFAMNKFMIKW